jgi:predicted amidohydrolase
MARWVPVALVQDEPMAGPDVRAFAAHARSVLRRFPRTRLLVYPELHLYGDAADYLAQAEPLTGPRAAELGRLAAELGIWLLPGTLCERPEDGSDGVFNTAALFSPRGELAAAYRKCFPWRPYEPYRPGAEFVVADTGEIGRVGLSICYDTWFPEVARQLGWLGAELIVTPTQTTTSDREQELVLARAAAIANQVYVLSLNAAGPTGVGRSAIIDPEGRVRVSADGGAQVLTDVLNLDDVARVREHGTAGLNRMWRQFRTGDPILELPAYQGRIDPSRWRPEGDAG